MMLTEQEPGGVARASRNAQDNRGDEPGTVGGEFQRVAAIPRSTIR